MDTEISLSKRAKGNRTRRKAEEFWRNLGYLVDRVELSGKFVRSKDLFSNDNFGGFDIVALKPKEFLMIQLKTNVPPTQSPYKKFAKKYATDQIKIICQTWYSHKGWRIQEYLQNGTIEETDLRK